MCLKNILAHFSYYNARGNIMRNIKLTIEYDGKDFGRLAKTTE